MWGADAVHNSPLVTDLEFDGPDRLWAALSNSTPYALDSDFQFSANCPTAGLQRWIKNPGGPTWSQTSFSLPVPNANCVYAIAPIYATGTRGCTSTMFAGCTAPGKCLLAATKNGIYLSTNADVDSPTWTQQTLPGIVNNSPISDIFYGCNAPLTVPTVYAATYLGDPSNPNDPSTALNRVIKSMGNQVWTVTGYPTGVRVHALGGTPQFANTVYVAAETGQVHKTTNGGDIFAELNVARKMNAGYPMATVVVGSADGNIIYVGTVCQSGIFKGVRNPGNNTWTWTPQRRTLSPGSHDHFHYVMRITVDANGYNTIYATDQDSLWRFGPNQTTWEELFVYPAPDRHLNGLALMRDNPQRLCVSSGFGNWGSTRAENKVWCSEDGGTNWDDKTPANANYNGSPQPPGPCDPLVSVAGCTSVMTLARHPTNPDIIYAATFGSENDPGKYQHGKGIGMVRTLDGGASWQPITAGLAASGINCTTNPENPACLSLYVGSIVMDSTGNDVWIATLNGIYKWNENIGRWEAKNGNLPANATRFEAIAVDPADATNNTIYIGSSEPGVLGGLAPPARIFKTTTGGTSWPPMTITPDMQPDRAWSDRFRVRDIQIRGTVAGQPKGYAVIEGAGIYMLLP